MATGTEVLDVGRRDHIVLFYRDEQELTERVSEYLLPAIQDGGVAIVVATPEHGQASIFSPPSKPAAWRSWSPCQNTAGPSRDTLPTPASTLLQLVRAVTLRLTQARRCAASWSPAGPIPLVSGRRSAPCSGRRPRPGGRSASSVGWSGCSGMLA